LGRAIAHRIFFLYVIFFLYFMPVDDLGFLVGKEVFVLTFVLVVDFDLFPYLLGIGFLLWVLS